jgi:hypothetical protein
MSQATEKPGQKLAYNFAVKVIGRSITGAYYDEASGMPVIMLDEGEAAIFIQRDDEGNGPGVPVLCHTEQGQQKETGMWQIQY